MLSEKDRWCLSHSPAGPISQFCRMPSRASRASSAVSQGASVHQGVEDQLVGPVGLVPMLRTETDEVDYPLSVGH